MEKFTSIIEVDRISEISDPVLRNFQITQSYHELSSALSTRMGGNANWCTFATWASRQAGQTIRKEDLTQALDKRLKSTPLISQLVTEIARLVIFKGASLDQNKVVQMIWETIDPGAAMNRASVAVASGNQKVYAEIGREFARFLAECQGDAEYNIDHIDKFCAVLRPGDPPDGQLYLRQAFKRYYNAIFEANPKARAELILLANLEIGFHEQTRLQPEIAAALESSVEDPQVILKRLTDTFFPENKWFGWFKPMFAIFFNRPTPLDNAIDRFVIITRHQIRLFLTDHMMELGFPRGQFLHLGDDLSSKFPEMLTELTNFELVSLLKRIDPTTDSLVESGAIDWADLPDRVHFIADLFRCFQESKDLLTAPFEQQTTESIVSGRLPEIGRNFAS